jgi:hypothetical protein
MTPTHTRASIPSPHATFDHDIGQPLRIGPTVTLMEGKCPGQSVGDRYGGRSKPVNRNGLLVHVLVPTTHSDAMTTDSDSVVSTDTAWIMVE